jgi:hypothetical protein
MPNDAQKTLATPGRRYRWQQGLDLALLVGSVAATVIAVTVVVALFWWLYASPTQKPTVAAPRQPVPPLQAPAARVPQAAVAAAAVAVPTAAPVPKRPPANPPMQPAAPAAPAAEPPRRPAYTRTRDGDAERNRELAQGLQRLARDPEARRQLGLPGQDNAQ